MVSDLTNKSYSLQRHSELKTDTKKQRPIDRDNTQKFSRN